jgi:hypothetical protein
MIQSLTKENFFDELHDMFPDAVEHFFTWLNEYKKEVGWDLLFQNAFFEFQDLPFDMQNGIIARYELELFNNGHGNGKEIYEGLADKYRVQIRNIFIELQLQINRRKLLKAVK